MLKNKWKALAIWVGKVFLAACLAFLALTIFCLAYYNVPYHYPSDTGATDHKWKPYYAYSRGTEGFACGRLNNDGFNNQFDYTKDMKIDVLVMGSSHMEGFNVMPSENTASILNNELKDKTVYNIGTSAHVFLACCKNLEAALEAYKPSQYVMIETSNIDLAQDDLIKFNKGEFPELNKQTDGLLAKLSRNQYLRLLYSQIQSYLSHNKPQNKLEADEVELSDKDNIEKSNDKAKDNINNKSSDVKDETDKEDTANIELDKLLTTLSDTAKKHNTKLIIMYHPATGLNEDGSLSLPDNDLHRAEFLELCQQKGIIFLDMTEKFKYEYEQHHLLPHGFSNTSVGRGHINKYGHRMIADELKKIIGE